MKTVKMFTSHGPVYLDPEQLAGNRTQLTKYTSRGNKEYEMRERRGEKDAWLHSTVHRANIFPTLALAIAKREEFYTAMRANQLQAQP